MTLPFICSLHKQLSPDSEYSHNYNINQGTVTTEEQVV